MNYEDAEKQIFKAVMYAKKKGKITNKEYREINDISRQMATIELSNLVKKRFLSVKARLAKVLPIN